MSITTYAELKTALADWSHRADLTSKMGDFIALAEARFNDALRLKAQTVIEDLTASTSSRFLSFPSGMKVLKSLSYVDGTDWVPIEAVVPEVMDEVYVESSGTPLYYSATDQIEFDCIPSTALTIKARVVKEFGALSDSVTSNDLLTEYPNIYLASALIELFDYTQDDVSKARWEAKYAEAVALANLTAHRTRSRPTLKTDIPAGYGTYNINTDQ